MLREITIGQGVEEKGKTRSTGFDMAVRKRNHGGPRLGDSLARHEGSLRTAW